MKGGSIFKDRAGLDEIVKALIAGLVVLVAMVASALGQSTGSTSAATPPPDSSNAQAAAPRAAHTARKPFRAARLSFLEGNVVVEQARSRTQDVAVLNMPLVEGTVLSTGDDGQAEIEFEDGSVARITPNSGVALLSMSVDGDGNYQTRIAVVAGLVYADLRAGTKYQYSIDAGGSVATPTENSTIRINLDEPPALIAIVQGSVHMGAADSTATIDAQTGQTARADAGGQSGVFMVKDEIASETWDQWNADRDQIAAGASGSQTAARDQYAGDQGYGWSDLDANGNWYQLPGQAGGQGTGQGLVWQPDEAEDFGADDSGEQSFDPYSYGSWVWTPAGYSWASSYSWGWLPYRCGQWAYFDQFGWGWQPSLSCGAFGFGGFGFGGYGFGVNTGRAPGFWRHPKRPIPGPGPVHPIIHGRVGAMPLAELQSASDGRLIRVKTINGSSIEPLPPVASLPVVRSGNAPGSALRRDYPVNTITHEPLLGLASIHNTPQNGRSSYQPSAGFQGGRSYLVPAFPADGSQHRPASVMRSPLAPRSAPAPAPRSSAAPAAHSAPAGSPHK